MSEPILPPLKPIPIKDRVSVLFVERGQLDVIDGAFVLVDKNAVRTHIPVGSITCLMLEPGTRVSHAAACWSGSVRPGFGSTPPASRAARGLVDSFIKPN